MGPIKKLFQITPVKLSWLIALVFLTLMLIYGISPGLLPPLQSLDQKMLDQKFRFRGPLKPTTKILVVAGDEKAFRTFGRWPWDRGAVFAPVLKKICQSEPKAVGFDIVFSEPDQVIPSRVRGELQKRLGGPSVLDDLLKEKSGDKALAEAIQFCGKKTVLAYSLSLEDVEADAKPDFQQRSRLLLEHGNNQMTSMVRGKAKYPRYPLDPEANLDFYFIGRSGLMNIPALTPGEVSQGYINNAGDTDGNYRHISTFYRLEDSFVPSLSMRLAQKAFASDAPPTLLVQPDLPERNQGQGLRLELSTPEGPRQIPVDLHGRMLINYRGPTYTFPNVSFADVFSNSDTAEYKQIDENGELKTFRRHKSDLFKDAIVLIGITATALYDIRPRPLDAFATGVENHANAVDNILTGDFLIKPSTEVLVWTSLGMAVLSLLYGWLLSALNSNWGFLVSGTLLSSLMYLDFNVLFVRGVAFPGILYAMQFLMQYIGVTLIKYRKEENEKRFIRSAFDKFVAPTVVESMIKDPTKLKLGGERKEITILFSDIRGFTELSEKVDAKLLTGFLNDYLGAMTDILQKNSGTLDKYIGDAVMGFWGAPVEVADPARMAVKTAVEMVTKVEEMNVEFEKKYGFKIEIGIGVNSGPVSVGNFGSSRVFEYTVIGDHVNLASRTEGLNKYYNSRILVTENTQHYLRAGEHLVREVDTVKVKGKKNAVKIYEVIPEVLATSELKSSLSSFNDGLMNYYSRRWDKALELFQKAFSLCKTDKLCFEMMERCKYYQTNPPANEWDGSWEMHSK